MLTPILCPVTLNGLLIYPLSKSPHILVFFSDHHCGLEEARAFGGYCSRPNAVNSQPLLLGPLMPQFYPQNTLAFQPFLC